MTSKEYLSQFSDFKSEVHNKLEYIENLKDKAMKITTFPNEHGGSRIAKTDSMESSIIEFMDLEREVVKDIDKLIQIENTIQKSIDKLSDRRCRTIIELRYLLLSSWATIEMKTGYSYKQCKRLEQQALKEIILTSECPLVN